LKLRQNDISEPGAKDISTCFALRNLTLLNLSRNDITDAGIAHIAGSAFMQNLE
jgi:hypothetical protein